MCKTEVKHSEITSFPRSIQDNSPAHRHKLEYLPVEDLLKTIPGLRKTWKIQSDSKTSEWKDREVEALLLLDLSISRIGSFYMFNTVTELIHQ